MEGQWGVGARFVMASGTCDTEKLSMCRCESIRFGQPASEGKATHLEVVLERLPVPLQVPHDRLRPFLEPLAVRPEACHLARQPAHGRLEPPALLLKKAQALVVLDKHLVVAAVQPLQRPLQRAGLLPKPLRLPLQPAHGR